MPDKPSRREFLALPAFAIAPPGPVVVPDTGKMLTLGTGLSQIQVQLPGSCSCAHDQRDHEYLTGRCMREKWLSPNGPEPCECERYVQEKRVYVGCGMPWFPTPNKGGY